MGSLLSYSIATSIVLACLYLAYRWTMSGERQFALNRVTLYLIYIFSFISVGGLVKLPGIFPWSANKILSDAVEIDFTGLDLTGIASGVVEEGQPLWLSIIICIYAVGIGVAAARFLFSLWKISSIIRKGERMEDYEGYKLIVVSDRKLSPFSCLGYIVITGEDYRRDINSIITHELTHLRGRHWIDLMIANVVAIFQWFNPAAWLMIEEFKTVHEYEADDSVIRSGADITQYQYLLIEKAVGERLPSPANSLNHSKLKKRVTMMYKSKPRIMRRVASLATIPALLAGITIVNSSAVASVISDMENASVFPQEQSVANTPIAMETEAVDNSADKVTNFSADNEISAGNSAAPVAASVPKDKDEVFTAVDKLPEYPGGMNAMMTFLMQNVRYPENAMKNNIQGRVIVKFVVGKDGKIGDVSVVRGVDPEIDAEAVRAVKSMPAWIPGENNGTPVATYYHLPVAFKLQEDVPNDSTINK